MDKVTRARELREQILALTKEYYAAAHDHSCESFEPGKSRINYAGRCFDAAEMTNLVDSALEFCQGALFGGGEGHFFSDPSGRLYG